jgi:tRNA(Arg) A34 adenosine deaminase TadA
LCCLRFAVSYQVRRPGLRGIRAVNDKSLHGDRAGRSARCGRAGRSAGRRRAGAERRDRRAGGTAHAEVAVIREAAKKLGQERLTGADLYVTLEPCTLCAAAISFARIRRLYYGADDPKGGAVESGVRFFAQPTCHHAPDVYSGLSGVEAAEILKDFFAGRR